MEYILKRMAKKSLSSGNAEKTYTKQNEGILYQLNISRRKCNLRGYFAQSKFFGNNDQILKLRES